MIYTKYPHRANFTYGTDIDAGNGRLTVGERALSWSAESFEGGVHHIVVDGDAAWKATRLIDELTPPPKVSCGVRVAQESTFEFLDDQGNVALRGVPGRSFGVCGPSWIFRFESASDSRFYGLGEKQFGKFELSGLSANFYNTDVWADFHYTQWLDSPIDPAYASVPYVVMSMGGRYFGILAHCPATAFVDIPGTDASPVFEGFETTSLDLAIGAYRGRPDLWVIMGPTLRDVTRKLQKLVGLTPLPPLWALGYHQSRWGYASEADLVGLDEKFAEHEIPCDGLWLDIDYMRGYRVFTVDTEHFPNGVASAVRQLAPNDRKIVPILDPGIKFEPGLNEYDDALSKDVLCRNPEGKPFVGMVWPGETVFPDLTIAEGRDWWAENVSRFAKRGFHAAWLDMNDPSTGQVDPNGMLFNGGAEPHADHRNQYALGMQKASYEGFLDARPNHRPFLLSRSGFVGTSRYSALWTGDNYSSYFYLNMAIPASLNLSLSGVPFNACDVGGFGGEPFEQLFVDWVKATFLFPIMRNHSSGRKTQEPWAFDEATLRVTRHYLRLRYRFIPFLYNLFWAQAVDGDPMLRPLNYEFADLKLDDVGDQFMVGPSLMQAPLLAKKRSRKAILPGDRPWFDLARGTWVKSGRLTLRPGPDETPCFAREGAVVPMAPGEAKTNAKDLTRVEMLVVANPTEEGHCEYVYTADAGEGFEYRDGAYSTMRVRADWKPGELRVEALMERQGFGPVDATFLTPIGFKSVFLNGKPMGLKRASLRLAGDEIEFLSFA